MKKIVISLGGSVLIPSLESNTIRQYVPVLQEIAASFCLFIVVGGGGEARRYIGAARSLGISEASADEIGISVTRLNARLLIEALGSSAYPKVAEDYAEAKEYALSGKIVVMGGITPGQTTDAVSAVLGEYVGADVLINTTSVDGIYSADPRKHPSAERFSSLTPQELMKIVGGERLVAGSNTVFDLVAAKVIERSGIPLVVVDGKNPDTLRNAIFRGEFTGTVVSEKKKSPLPIKR